MESLVLHRTLTPETYWVSQRRRKPLFDLWHERVPEVYYHFLLNPKKVVLACCLCPTPIYDTGYLLYISTDNIYKSGDRCVGLGELLDWAFRKHSSVPWSFWTVCNSLRTDIWPQWVQKWFLWNCSSTPAHYLDRQDIWSQHKLHETVNVPLRSLTLCSLHQRTLTSLCFTCKMSQSVCILVTENNYRPLSDF